MSEDHKEPIAIIGFAAKFPGDGATIDGFWRMLCERRSARSEVPPDRFNVEAFYNRDNSSLDTLVTKHGYFLKDDPAAFDAPFFNISPAEASCMDPQQRMLLEVTYHALENAGLQCHKVENTATSVHIAAFSNDYPILLSKDFELQSQYKATGTGPALLANRVSHFFDLKGPSLVLDTACSSSLYALHLSCQSLRSRETNMGLVGGASLILTPDALMIPLGNAGFLSPDGKCYSFDHRANGYARGEGTGMLVLKRLDDALRDGDMIRAVIRATGVNQDGKTPGVTQPSIVAQRQLILETYRQAGLSLSDTRFVESHGTGTAVGDPIEAEAIGTAFQGVRACHSPLFIGAAKSNIGHIEGTSGIAALVKTILVLEKGVIPPNAEFEKVNPAIDACKLCLEFPTELIPWPTRGLRRASVNNFGYGGSNAHVVLDDAYHYLQQRGLRGITRGMSLPAQQAQFANGGYKDDHDHHVKHQFGQCDRGYYQQKHRPKLLVFSAMDSEGLQRQAKAYHRHFSSLDSTESSFEYLESVAHVMSRKRSVLPWKAFAVVHSLDEVKSKLLERLSVAVRSSGQPNLVFIFTGQGAQWPSMGYELMAYKPFRQSLEAADRHFCSLGASWSLIDQITGAAEASQIHRASISQAACTALQIALVDLLRSWNIFPAAAVGHSSGEIASAYCVGALTCKSAWTVAYWRGVLSQQLSDDLAQPFTMMAVALSEADVLRKIYSLELQNDLFVGCTNAPDNSTVTGTEDSISKLESELKRDAIFARKLNVHLPYHSPFMEQIAVQYLNSIREIKGDAPATQHGKSCPVISSVTGTVVDRETMSSPEYWVKNLLSKVNFFGALQSLHESSLRASNAHSVFLEVGPSPALQRAVKDSMTFLNNAKTSYFPLLQRDMSAFLTTFDAAGSLFSLGCKPDLAALNPAWQCSSFPQLWSDLPSYQFARPQRYWLDSRIIRNFRMHGRPRQELLGVRNIDWSPHEPSWRNVVNTKMAPWIKDHVIGNSVIYSAAGLLLMAVEAVRQLVVDKAAVTGYSLKDVRILKAVVIDDARPTEIHISLRCLHGDSREMRSYQFRLSSVTGDLWAEIGHGTVQVELSTHAKKMAGRDLQDVAQKCFAFVHKERIYGAMAEFGFQYGPSFRVIDSAVVNHDGDVSARLSLDEAYQKKTPGTNSSRLLHPALLDGVFQLMIVGLSEGGVKPVPPIAFTQIQALWLSNALSRKSDVEHFDTTSRITLKAYRDVETSALAVDGAGEPMIYLQGNRGTAIESFESAAKKQRGFQRLCSRIVWQPMLSLHSPLEIQKYLDPLACDHQVDHDRVLDQSEALSLYFIQKTSRSLKEISLPEEEHSQLCKYLTWMHRVANSAESTLKSRRLTDSEFESLLSTTDNLHIRSRVVLEIGQSLVDILRRRVDALQILFSGNLAQEYYDTLLSPMAQRLGTYLALLSHESPGLKVLEVGAGVGSATIGMLEALTYRSGSNADDVKRYKEYMYTDISPAFFEKAKTRFEEHASRMSFQKLDIGNDPLAQGFECRYDIVVASAVLHATPNLLETLLNVRKLLKPGGRLLCIELSDFKHLSVQFWTGLLQGWWLSTEEFRQESPLVSEEKWDILLKSAGFDGIELAFRDSDREAYHTLTGFVAQVQTAPSPRPNLKTNNHGIIVVNDASKLQQSIASRLQLECKGLFSTLFEIMRLDQVTEEAVKEKIVFFLPELHVDFFDHLGETTYGLLKMICLSCTRMMWLTQGAALKPSHPKRHMVSGFARTMCSESGYPKIIVLNLPAKSSEGSIVENTIRVAKRTIFESRSQCDFEFNVSNDMVQIGRVAPAGDLNEIIVKSTSAPSLQMEPISVHSNKCLELRVGTPGMLDTLHFKTSSRCSDSQLTGDNIEVEVYAAGLSFKDVLIALGVVPGAALGFEAAGIVRRKGPDAPFDLGDRVVCLTAGSFATFLRLKSDEAVKIPPYLSFTSAAALPSAFVTAWYSLKRLARLSRGEIVLIHAAAGGVGQAAIQIAQLIGAQVYATVGSPEKKRLLIDRYAIPNTHIFSSRNDDFCYQVSEATSGRGVDVVLNCLSGLLLQYSLQCIAPLGRFIEIGKRDINANSVLPMAAFSKSIMFASVDLEVHYELARQELHEILEEIVGRFGTNVDGLTDPHPVHIYAASQITQAFLSMQSGANMGKNVIEFQNGDEIKVSRDPNSKLALSGHATYLLAGGLGGLGQNIIRWMISCGARYFLILSRSGAANNPLGAKFVERVSREGVRVEAPACDVSNLDLLRETIHSHIDYLPPIRGCIQAGMVLHNKIFESLSFANFQAAIAPKVAGSWNLHQCLPEDLDFYLLFSSFAGIHGNLRQSNYAAGNTYQDALAHYRTARGQRCVSLDIGVVGHAGRVATHEVEARAVREAGYNTIEEAQLLAVMEMVCDPAWPISPEHAQVILGVDTPETLKTRGVRDWLPWLDRPFFSYLGCLGQLTERMSDKSENVIDYRGMVSRAKDLNEASNIVSQGMKVQLARSLCVDEQNIDVSKPPFVQGVDSLMAIELRTWFTKALDTDVPLFKILKNWTITDLCGSVAKALRDS